MNLVYALIVILLWRLDNLLLLRLERWIKRKTISLAWYIVKVYTLMTQKNEMKKDGYHVDSVFLYTQDPGESYMKQYDTLRIFRDLIREEQLSIGKSKNIYDFIERCCDPNSNLKQVDREKRYELEVNYTFDYNEYRIVFDTVHNPTIRFPIYSETDIRNRDIMDGGINLAFIAKDPSDDTGYDITPQMKRLSGPLENFYDNTEYKVCKSWLYKHSVLPENGVVKVLDFKGDEYVFGANDEFLTFQSDQ